MITQYRPAYYTAPRAAEYAGRSIDTKPINVENGATYDEIDTGRTYMYDAENKLWVEYKATGAASGVKSVNGKTGNVVLTASDVEALPITGGTLTGDLYIMPENRTGIILATMASGAVVQFKESNSAYINATIDTAGSVINTTSGPSQAPVILRSVAEPQIESDAANKTYVDNKVIIATHTIHTLAVDANSTFTEQVSVVLPTGINSVTHDFYVTIGSDNNTMALFSVTKTEAVSSSSGSWLRVNYLAYNPSSTAITGGDAVITVLCIKK